MSRRVRDPRLVGVSRWAITADGQLGSGAYFGIDPDSGLVARIDGDSTRDRIVTTAVVAGGQALSVSVDTADPLDPTVYVWVSGSDGTLTKLHGWDLTVSQQWVLQDFDGSPLLVTSTAGVAVIQAGRSGGRLSRFTAFGPDLVLQSDTYFPAPMVALAAVAGVLHAFTDDAKLWVLSYDPQRAAYRRERSISIPQAFGLRDATAVNGGTILSLVGTDRMGNGCVIRVECGAVPLPAVVTVGRGYADAIVLTAMDTGRIGTILPQSPTTLPEVPWNGRTDALRGLPADGLLFVARPRLGEVWISGVGGNPAPPILSVLLLSPDVGGWLLLGDGSDFLLSGV